MQLRQLNSLALTIFLTGVGLLLFGASGAGQPICDAELDSVSHAVINCYRLGLEKNDFDGKVLGDLLAKGDGLPNPYDFITTFPGVGPRKQALAQALTKVDRAQVQKLKEALLPLIEEKQSRELILADAKAQTKNVLNPRTLGPLADTRNKSVETVFHKNQIFMYDPQTYLLKGFSLPGGQNHFTRKLKQSDNGKSDSNLYSILSARSGSLFITQGRGNRAFVHNKEAGQTWPVEVSGAVKSLQLLDGPEDKVYLAVRTERQLHVYKILPDGVHHEKTFSFETEVKGLTVLTNSHLHVVLVAFDGYHTLHILEPLKGSSKEFASTHQISDINGAVNFKGEYVISFTAKSEGSPTYRGEFLTSQSEQTQYTAWSENSVFTRVHATAEGRLLVAVAKFLSVNIYEPLVPSKPPAQPLWRRILGRSLKKSALEPIMELPVNGSSTGTLKWANFENDRSLLYSLHRNNGSVHMYVWEPLASPQSLAAFNVGNEEWTSRHDADLIDLLDQTIALSWTSSGDAFAPQNFSARTLEQPLINGDHERVWPLFKDMDGNIYFAYLNHIVTPVPGYQLMIVALTSS